MGGLTVVDRRLVHIDYEGSGLLGRYVDMAALHCDWCDRRWPADGIVELGELNMAAADGWTALIAPGINRHMCRACYENAYTAAVA